MIYQLVKFDVKPEYREVFKTTLLESKEGTLHEAGCVEMSLFVDKSSPNAFFSYERWKDQAAIDYHMEQPHTEKIRNLVGAALQSKLEIYNLGESKPLPVPQLKQANPEDKVFAIFFIFKIKPGTRDRVLKQFEKHVELTRQEDGNIVFDIYTVDGTEDTLAVYEHWRNESALWDIHFKQPYSDETGALLSEAMVGEMEDYMNIVTEVV